MLNTNFIKKRLSTGKAVLGTWVIIPSVVNIDIITGAGLDFVIIDREHGPISYQTAQEMAIACVANGASPIMRVGDIDKSAIQNVLDIGMHGIQVPNIESSGDASLVVKYTKYPPLGDRGFSPFTRSGGYSINSSSMLMEASNANTIVVVNIEGEQAIRNLDDILAIEGIDVIFVGLFDLSKALGIPGEVNSPILNQVLGDIVTRSRLAGKHVGTISTSLERLRHFRNLGVTYLVHLVDCDMLRSVYSSVVQDFNLSSE